MKASAIFDCWLVPGKAAGADCFFADCDEIRLPLQFKANTRTQLPGQSRGDFANRGPALVKFFVSFFRWFAVRHEQQWTMERVAACAEKPSFRSVK